MALITFANDSVIFYLVNPPSFLNRYMKSFLRIYLYASLAITTSAVIACFLWYVQEYDLAYKLDRSGKIDLAELHRTNSLWLGLWGGIYGLTGVVAAAALLSDRKESK